MSISSRANLSFRPYRIDGRVSAILRVHVYCPSIVPREFGFEKLVCCWPRRWRRKHKMGTGSLWDLMAPVGLPLWNAAHDGRACGCKMREGKVVIEAAQRGLIIPLYCSRLCDFASLLQYSLRCIQTNENSAWIGKSTCVTPLHLGPVFFSIYQKQCYYQNWQLHLPLAKMYLRKGTRGSCERYQRIVCKCYFN